MSNDPGAPFRTIWLHADDPAVVQIIDQRRLPHRYEVVDLRSHADGAFAIREMLVRGAPLIGATAAWSVYLAALEARASGKPLASQLQVIRTAAETLKVIFCPKGVCSSAAAGRWSEASPQSVAAIDSGGAAR